MSTLKVWNSDLPKPKWAIEQKIRTRVEVLLCWLSIYSVTIKLMIDILFNTFCIDIDIKMISIKI